MSVGLITQRSVVQIHPSLFKKMEKLILGIDEAGRGPVIGPLVIAGVLIKEEDLPKLEHDGIKDSKLLSKKQREHIKDHIEEVAEKIEIIEIPPSEIDDTLNSSDLNLNWLEALKVVELINKLQPQKVILDCPSNNIKAFTEYIKERINNKKVEIISEHKADLNHKIVAAASILAKLTRDKRMEEIQEKYGNCGPGYPANEITQNFLKENYDKHPEIFRQTWASYQNVLKKKKQKALTDY